MPTMRDISENPTQIVHTDKGFAGEVQDVIGWLKVTDHCIDADAANLCLLALGYQETEIVIEAL